MCTYISFEILISFYEDFFECRHGDAVAENVQLIHPFIKLGEEIFKLCSLIVADLESDLLRHLGQFLHFAKDSFKIWLDHSVWLLMLFDHCELVASSVAIFQE